MHTGPAGADKVTPIDLGSVPGVERDAFGKPVIPLDPEGLYGFGDLIRRTEELILAQFSRGLVSGTTHTCLGQELCAMAVVRALDHPDDAVLSNHRNHGHFLTYSGDFVGLVAEVMGREAGMCGGHGGSQHLAFRHFHSNGVQGGMTGIGAGLALARRLEGSGAVVAVMVGDGTLGQGLLYESLNLVSVWAAPLLLVVENNGIAQTTYTRHTIGGTIEGRGEAFGLTTWRLSDDSPDFFEQVEAVVRQVRQAGRPGFLVIDTRRLGPHSKGDDLREAEEVETIRARDPLAALGRRLAPGRREAIEARNATYVAAVQAAANVSPEAGFARVPEHIFSRLPTPAPVAPMSALATGANVRAALNAALRFVLEQSERTVLLGEDLHDPYGGAFKVTQGLSTDFPGRVLSTPISEAGITGAAIGLALAGYRPVLEVMFADFLTLCMDQLYNHAVKFPGVFGAEVPLVVRTPSGGRRGYGPTHSQSPENLFTAVPGLTVVYGSQRHAVGRLLADATLRWPYPTLFFEHKLLYGETIDPGDYQTLPEAGDVATELFPILMQGDARPDVTLVTYGGMLPVVERAVAHLRAVEELAVRVVVPSLLAPLPRLGLVRALLDSPRVAVVEESHHDFGVGAEVLATLAEAGYRGKVARIGTPPVPISSARSLERHLIPDESRLAERVLALF